MSQNLQIQVNTQQSTLPTLHLFSLHTVCQAMLMRAVQVEGTMDRIANLPSLWSVATTCSGCGTFEIALNSVANAMSAHTPVDHECDIEVP